MIELADLIVLNKFERHGGEDALREIGRQWRRDHPASGPDDRGAPVFPTVASRWNDPGVDRLHEGLMALVGERGFEGYPPREMPSTQPSDGRTVPSALVRPGYLAEIAETLRGYRRNVEQQAEHFLDSPIKLWV